MYTELNLTELDLEYLTNVYILGELPDHLLDIIDKILKSSYSENRSYRNAKIFKMRKDGHTYSQIADTFHISIARAKQIVSAEERRENYHNRLKNAEDLTKLDFLWYLDKVGKDKSISEAVIRKTYNTLRRAALIDHTSGLVVNLDNVSDEYLLNIRGIGVITLELVREAYDMYKLRDAYFHSTSEHMAKCLDQFNKELVAC